MTLRLLLLVPLLLGMRPLACAQTACAEELARVISGASDAPAVPEAAYQQTLRVLVTVYQRSGRDPRDLNAVRRVLTEYVQDFQAEGLVWQARLLPLLDAVVTASTVIERRQATKRLRRAVEQMATARCE
jgi:hypothetical protein